MSAPEWLVWLTFSLTLLFCLIFGLLFFYFQKRYDVTEEVKSDGEELKEFSSYTDPNK